MIDSFAEQVQHGRKWSGKPFDDRVAAYLGGEDIGQVRPTTAHLFVDAFCAYTVGSSPPSMTWFVPVR